MDEKTRHGGPWRSSLSIPKLPTSDIHDPNTTLLAATSLAGHAIAQGVDGHVVRQLVPVKPLCVTTDLTGTKDAELVSGEI